MKNLVLILYFLIPANIMLYGINDYFDREIDKENPKKEGKETSYEYSTVSNLIIILSVFSIVPLLLIMPHRTYMLFLVFLVLSYQYSAPPLRLKTKPFFDSLSNGLYAMPFVIAYSSSAGSLPSVSLIAAGWLWTMAMHTFSAIPDIKPDREAGIKTTATHLGRKNTYIYVTAVWTLCALILSVNSLKLAGLFAIYPLITLTVYITDIADSRAYWWFPIINTLTGMIITIYGLLVYVSA